MTGAQIAAARDAQGGHPAGQRLDRAFSGFFRALMFGAIGISMLALVTLLYDVARDGIPKLSWDFLTSFPSRIIPANSGIESAIYGTLWLMVVCAVIVDPARDRDRDLPRGVRATARSGGTGSIEVNIQNLAAVPSVVYGILGLAFIVRGPFSLGRTVLAGGITLALLVLPVVIIVAREAIRAVPPSIREGSLALGATQWQTIWKQVLPGSIAGIATGVILALSRAIGETAPLLVIGAAVNPRFNPDGLGSAFTALPIQIFAWTQDPNREFVDLAAAAILVMMIVLLLMNSVAIFLRNRYEQKW